MRKIHFTLFLILVILSSCKPKKNMVYMSNENYEQEIAQAKYTGLHIQEGDQLLILVTAMDEIAVRPFNLNTVNKTSAGSDNSVQKTTPSEYLVNPEGYINFPILGQIYCKGMTQDQLKSDIESRLMRYLTDPIVQVNLKNFNISVLGEVKSSGLKTSPTQKLNVFQALALAGDMTDNADRTKVKLIRTQANGQDLVINIDISNAGIVNSPYYYLQQNDILYVEPDTNKQIAANQHPNRSLWFQIGGAALALVTLIITLSR